MEPEGVVRHGLACLFCLIACTAQAEIALTGDPGFGLGQTDSARPVPVPSFQQVPAGGITLRGNGRFGLVYDQPTRGEADVTLSTRLRVDLDVRHQTDGGVTFGGRIRAQAQGGTGTTVNAPTLYATWD